MLGTAAGGELECFKLLLEHGRVFLPLNAKLFVENNNWAKVAEIIRNVCLLNSNGYYVRKGSNVTKEF